VSRRRGDPLILSTLTSLGRAMFDKAYANRPNRETDGTKKASREDFALGFVGALRAIEAAGLTTGLLLARPTQSSVAGRTVVSNMLVERFSQRGA